MKIVIVPVAHFAAVILLAQSFAPSGYRWTQNTVSGLASQGHKHKWIMQAGFVGFGLLLNTEFISKFIAAKEAVYPDALIMLWGVGIALSGFFCTEPIDKSITYSATEARLHSICAAVAGICFSLGILWRLIVSSRPDERIFHLSFLTLVVGTSVLFGLSESNVIGIGRGLIQRVLYAVSFTWLLVQQYWGPLRA